MARIPYLVGVGVFLWLVATIDLDEARHAFERADTLRFLLVLGVSVVLVFIADAASWIVLFGRQGFPVPPRDVFRIKGVSYVVDAVDYAAAQASASWVLGKVRGGSTGTWLSILVWGVGVDLWVLVLLASAGLLLAPEAAPAWLDGSLPALLGAGAAGLALGFLVARRIPMGLFAGFRRAGLRDLCVVISARMGWALVFATYEWMLAPTFDIHVSWPTMLLLSPMLALAQSIPGSISGLGAAQPITMLVWMPFVAASVVDAEAQVFAYTTAYGVGHTLARLLLGLVFVRGIARDMGPGPEASSP